MMYASSRWCCLMRKLKSIMCMIVVLLPIIIFIINMVLSILCLFSLRIIFLSTIPFTYLSFDFHLISTIIRYIILIITIISVIFFILKKKKRFIVINLILNIILISDLLYFFDLLEFL